MESEREARISEHGQSVRIVPSKPDQQQLVAVVPKEWQENTRTVAASPPERGEKLEPLQGEEDRRFAQMRASSQVKAEQLRLLSEMEHAAHEAREERNFNRKSALKAMETERKSQIAEHGVSARAVPSKPDPKQLAAVVSKERQESIHTVHKFTLCG